MAFTQNERLSEATAVIGYLASASITTAGTTAAIDLLKNRKVIGYGQAGVLGTAATATFKVQGSVNGSSGWTDISGMSVTMVKATDDNKLQVLEVSSERVNALGLGYRYVRFSIGADVASILGIIALSAGGPEEPISSQNVAAVKATTVL